MVTLYGFKKSPYVLNVFRKVKFAKRKRTHMDNIKLRILSLQLLNFLLIFSTQLRSLSNCLFFALFKAIRVQEDGTAFFYY